MRGAARAMSAAGVRNSFLKFRDRLADLRMCEVLRYRRRWSVQGFTSKAEIGPTLPLRVFGQQYHSKGLTGAHCAKNINLKELAGWGLAGMVECLSLKDRGHFWSGWFL